jgi:hypothetical protein
MVTTPCDYLEGWDRGYPTGGAWLVAPNSPQNPRSASRGWLAKAGTIRRRPTHESAIPSGDAAV